MIKLVEIYLKLVTICEYWLFVDNKLFWRCGNKYKQVSEDEQKREQGQTSVFLHTPKVWKKLNVKKVEDS